MSPHAMFPPEPSRRPDARSVFSLALALVVLLAVGGCSASSHTVPAGGADQIEQVDDSFWTSVREEKQDDRGRAGPKRMGGEIERQDLVSFLDRGPAHLLRSVPVKPVMDGRALLGYEVQAFFPNQPTFQRVDIEPGDMIVAVNGTRIERPTHLFEVYEALRTAPRLQVDAIRGDTLRTLTWEIVDPKSEGPSHVEARADQK